MCDYLTELFNQGLSYSAVNTARSVFSSYILPENGVVCGQNPYICRLLKEYLIENLLWQDIHKLGIQSMYWIILKLKVVLILL